MEYHTHCPTERPPIRNFKFIYTLQAVRTSPAIIRNLIKVPIIFTLCILASNRIWGQTIRTYTPREMRQDVDSMVKYLQETHPNPFYRYPKVSFLKNVSRVKNQLNSNLNQVDFYLRIMPLLADLDDGHTDLHIGQIYQSLHPMILPYHFKLSTHAPFITLHRAIQGIKAGTTAGR